MKRRTVLLASLLFLSSSLLGATDLDDSQCTDGFRLSICQNDPKSDQCISFSAKETLYSYLTEDESPQYLFLRFRSRKSQSLNSLSNYSNLIALFFFLPFPFMLIWSVGKVYTGKVKWLLLCLATLTFLLVSIHLFDQLSTIRLTALNLSTKIFIGILLVFSIIMLGFIIPQTFGIRNDFRKLINKRRNDLGFLLSQMNDGFVHARVITDITGKPIDWKFLNVNEGFERLTGLKRDEIIGKTISHVLPDMNLFNNDWLERLGGVALNGSPNNTIDYFERFDSWFDISLYCPRKKEFAAIFKDISARVEAETKLKESETRFRNIFEKSKLGIALINEKGNPFLVNTQLCEVIGYTEEELLMMTFDKFTHPEDLQNGTDLYSNLLKGELDNYTLNKRFVSKGGEIVHARLNVSMVDDPEIDDRYGLAIIEDLTKQHQAEIKGEESSNRAEGLNQLLSEVTQLGRIGAWEIDMESEVCEWSDTVYDIHEISRGDEMQMAEAFDYYHPDYREAILEAKEKGLREDTPWDLELKIITASDRERWVRVIGQSVKDQNGKVEKLRGLIQDIHEKKVSELRLKATGEILRRMVDEKTSDLKEINQELESFTYSVSHDLRAPLRAISGFSEAIIEDFGQAIPAGANNYLQRISKNSKKMSQLIDDLLAFSSMKRKKVELRDVDTKGQINRIVNDVFFDSKEQIEIESLPEIYADEQMINHVFTNLISNAVKYSSKRDKPKITISASETDTDHIISVKDNGVGFEMEYYPKLFQVFQRLHLESEFEGTGIGLSICAKIMKAHDGEIWAESEVGKGAVFYLKFKKSRITQYGKYA